MSENNDNVIIMLTVDLPLPKKFKAVTNTEWKARRLNKGKNMSYAWWEIYLSSTRPAYLIYADEAKEV